MKIIPKGSRGGVVFPVFEGWATPLSENRQHYFAGMGGRAGYWNSLCRFARIVAGTELRPEPRRMGGATICGMCMARKMEADKHSKPASGRLIE